MGLDHVGVEVHAEAGLRIDSDEAVANVAAFDLEDLVHPIALAGYGFAGDEIPDGAGPLAGSPSVELAAGIVCAHGEAVGIGEVGDALGF